MRIRCLILTLTGLVATFSSTRGVQIEPPTLDQYQGAFVGSVAGIGYQRLVLNESGEGVFVDALYGESHRTKAYRVTMRQTKGYRVSLEMTDVVKNSSKLVVRGEADYFYVRLRLPRAGGLRAREVVLFRESIWNKMHEASKLTADSVSALQ